MEMRKLSCLPALLFALCAAELPGAVVDVPSDANAAAIKFKAGRDPIPFDFKWANASTKSIVVQPVDTAVMIDSNSGKRFPTKQAGFEFKGMGIVDFVRPNVALFKKEVRDQYINDWDKLPEIYGKEYLFEFEQRTEGVRFHINGDYAGFIPAEERGRIVQIDSPFAEKDFVFTNRQADPKYLPLDISGKSNPGAMTGASIKLTDSSIPFVAPTAANLDIGVTASHLSLYPGVYGDSGYTGRNAFDHPLDSYLFTIPMQQYSHAWLLCAVEEDPSKTPSVNVRLTRFVPSGQMGGRAYSAIADTVCAVPGPNAQQVGTVDVGGKTLPLWRIEARFDLGKVIDLITDPHGQWGRGAFPMHYLDFEITGETHKFRTPFGDPRPYPDPAKKSAVHVFGVTLERAPADVKFMQTSLSKNKFSDDEKPEMKVAVTPVIPGKYTLKWQITDAGGEDAGSGEFTTDTAVEKTIDLEQDDLGWFEVKFSLYDKTGNRLVTEHTASYVLLGPDTRQAGYESPYLGWAWNGAHYTDSRPEVYGLMAKKAGIRRALNLSNNRKLTEKDWEQWKVTELVASVHVSFPLKPDEQVKKEITEKLEKWPHANMVVVFWESAGPFGPYAQAPELIGKKPPEYDEARKKRAAERLAIVEQVGRVVRKDFPQLKVVFGNSLTCGELIAEILRNKPPKEYFTHIGTEAIQRTAHPEKPNVPFTMIWSRQLIDTAKALGYDYKVTCCPENISRKPDTIGQVNYAEWMTRDMLVQHAFGFEDIGGAGAGGTGVGNIYNASFYGSGANRAPYFYPERAFAATATLTRILDCVRFMRLVPTGSKTVYAAEFERRYDGKTIYAIWTSRGTAELSLELGSNRIEQVNLYGKTTRPSVQSDKMKITASTAAQYLITDAKVKAIACGRRTYQDEWSVPLPGFKVVDAVNSLDQWELQREPNKLVDDPATFRYTYDIYRALGKGEVKEVDDPEKGRCLEISIASNDKLHKLMSEYAVIKLKNPIPIEGEINSVGLWVKGNSGWGQIFWELEDAAGKKLVSSGLGQYGDVMDYEGRISIDFDGWAFLSMPVTGKSPIRELSTGSVVHVWSGMHSPKQPVKLTGIVFCAPAHPLYITDYGTCKQTIRVRDVSVISDHVGTTTGDENN